MDIVNIIFAAFVIRLITAAILYFMGRSFWCKCNKYNLWAAEVNSEHNSQHLADPYSFTHLLHGVLFFWLFYILHGVIPFGWRFLLTILVESVWEIVENSPAVIDRYRQDSISKGYTGDSIANSLGDTFCCGAGFFLAHMIGLRWSMIVFVITELIVLVWIKDNLTLNIIMLIHPVKAIKDWQEQQLENWKKQQPSKKND